MGYCDPSNTPKVIDACNTAGVPLLGPQLLRVFRTCPRSTVRSSALAQSRAYGKSVGCRGASRHPRVWQLDVRSACDSERPTTVTHGQSWSLDSYGHESTRSTFALVRALETSPEVVVRDRIELSTFRFSGALSPREQLPGKSSNSPAHAPRRCWPAILRAFNTHNKYTGVCRFVRGIRVGISHRVAELWGSCGVRRSPWLGRPTRQRVPKYRDFRILVTTCG
jgi:hypothetical protein